MPFLSKVSLKRDNGSTGTIVDILRRDRGLGGEHRLVWSLFSQGQGAKRDFLFRRSNNDGWLVLSQREPIDHHNIWHIETKSFQPTFHEGQKLAFRLRANPRISSRSECGRRVKHDHIQNVRMMSRAVDGSIPSVAEILPSASHGWISRQGERSGFSVALDQMVADCYVQQRFPRNSGGVVSFRSLDYRGILTVTDVDAFINAVHAGFGGSRAYGFGMMLVTKD